MVKAARPPRRTRAAVLAVLAVLLLSAGCSSEDPNQGGFVGSRRTLTQVAVPDREPAPVISGTGLDGQQVSFGDYAGKVIVLNVWGSWCTPCQAEAQDLQRASVKTRAKAQFIGINTRDPDAANAVAFVRSRKITFPSIYDPKGQLLLQFARDLPPSAIPSTLIIDAKGRLAVRILGSISEITLVDLIDDVAAGR